MGWLVSDMIKFFVGCSCAANYYFCVNCLVNKMSVACEKRCKFLEPKVTPWLVSKYNQNIKRINKPSNKKEKHKILILTSENKGILTIFV